MPKIFPFLWLSSGRIITHMEHRQKLRILLVEDNPGDVRLFQEALKGCALPCKIRVARDGEDARNILFLHRNGAEPLPDLIVLDLNLPKVTGDQILLMVKADAELRSIPVVILSSSESKADIQRSYENQASCYLVKPPNLFDYLRMVQACGDFWMSQAFLPSRVPAANAQPA
jgi:chemotaxis family two-component system response regulator Rcp1